MTAPSHLEKCKNCKVKFVPKVEVESLPVFNSVNKSRWTESKCPNCGLNYRMARVSRNSLEVIMIISQRLPVRESFLIAPAVS
jgi:hypothetical protein